MHLTEYHYTVFHTVAIPTRCIRLRVLMTCDEDGPELQVYQSDVAANDDEF